MKKLLIFLLFIGLTTALSSCFYGGGYGPRYSRPYAYAPRGYHYQRSCPPPPPPRQYYGRRGGDNGRRRSR